MPAGAQSFYPWTSFAEPSQGVGTIGLDTYEQMQNATLTDQTVVVWSDPNRGGIFLYDKNSVAVANTGTIIECLNGGRFFRIYSGPINVLWFNADKTGATLSTGAIQAAANTGEDVYHPAGDYQVAGNITILSSGQRIFGDGAATRIYQQTRNMTIFYVQSNPTGTRLSNITFDSMLLECTTTGTKSSQTDQGCAIFANKTLNLTIHSLVVTGFSGYVLYGVDCWNVEVRNNRLYGNILNENIGGESSYDIYFLGQGIRIKDNWCLSNIKVHIAVNTDSLSESMQVLDNFCCAWDSTTGRMLAVGSVLIVNNIQLVYSNNSTNEFSSVVTCKGNFCFGSRASGIYISGEPGNPDTSGARAIIQANTVMNSGCNTTYNALGIQGGICILNCREAIVGSNLVINHQGTDTPSIFANILTTGGRLTIVDNIIRNAKGIGIRAATMPGGMRISGNVIVDHRREAIVVESTSGTFDRGPAVISENIIEWHTTDEVGSNVKGIWCDFTDAQNPKHIRIVGNSIRRKSATTGVGHGILCITTNATIAQNFCENLQRGIYNSSSITTRAASLIIDANVTKDCTYHYDFTTSGNGVVIVQRPTYSGTASEKLRNSNTTSATYHGVRMGENFLLMGSAAPSLGASGWLLGDRMLGMNIGNPNYWNYNGTAWSAAAVVLA